jgi:hypothetical protein
MAAYNYYQPKSGTKWIIPHKLGSRYLAIDVFVPMGNGVYSKLMPEQTDIVDDNTVVVTFTSPTSGRARIVSQTI